MIDNITQYIAKIFKFLLLENFNKNLTANNPERYAKIKPEATAVIVMLLWDMFMLAFLKPFANSKIKEPRITGMEIKKENLTASSLFTPKILAVDIVDPEREIPGNIAIA